MINRDRKKLSDSLFNVYPTKKQNIYPIKIKIAILYAQILFNNLIQK